VYVGNGYTVGARSSAQGVQRFKMSGYNWTHWARPAVSEKETTTRQTDQPDAVTGADKPLKRYRVTVPAGSKTNTVRSRVSPDKNAGFAQWLHAGTIVTGCEAAEHADGWTAIQSDKSYGNMKSYMMTQFLEEVST